MEVKKNSEVDGDKVKSSMTIIGLSYVAALTLAVFTFGQVNLEEDENEHAAKDVETTTERTDEDEPPPPPPPEEVEIQITPEPPEEVIIKENIEEEPPPAVTPPAPPPPVEVVEEVVAPIVDFPDVEAGFPGGPAAMMKWINDNVKYPQTSIEMNEQGRVFLSFVVETNGSISNVKIERGISIDLDKEAKRVIKKMPKWVPGESAGRAVRARCRLPINFQLQ
ncbi:MAG: energy transducer TonB [Flavobacteriales bacterium]|jgi:protein TonB|nr:energy transducer TonB [Flavobacteriales bacterium]